MFAVPLPLNSNALLPYSFSLFVILLFDSPAVVRSSIAASYVPRCRRIYYDSPSGFVIQTCAGNALNVLYLLFHLIAASCQVRELLHEFEGFLCIFCSQTIIFMR